MHELTAVVESAEMVAIGVGQRFGSGDVICCIAESTYASTALTAKGE
jgi:hypothetical protein